MIDMPESIFGLSPPPRKSDVLFDPNSEDWPLNAGIQHWGNVDYAYKAGFRKAALQLTERMCNQPIDQDTIVYPIAYLYRHHVELMLKDIFHLTIELLEVPVSSKQKNTLASTIYKNYGR